MRKSLFLQFIYLIPILLFFNSCDFFRQDPYVKFDMQSFTQAKSLWESLNTNCYNFTYSINSDATGPNSTKVHVRVENGSSSYTVTDDEEEGIEYPNNNFPTVESIFEFIGSCYEDDVEDAARKPEGIDHYEILVSYDQNTGIPTSIEMNTYSDGSYCGGSFSMTIEIDKVVEGSENRPGI